MSCTPIAPSAAAAVRQRRHTAMCTQQAPSSRASQHAAFPTGASVSGHAPATGKAAAADLGELPARTPRRWGLIWFGLCPTQTGDVWAQHLSTRPCLGPWHDDPNSCSSRPHKAASSLLRLRVVIPRLAVGLGRGRAGGKTSVVAHGAVYERAFVELSLEGLGLSSCT